jgi:hypothetical protein
MSFYTSATCGTVDAVIDDDFPGPSWTSSLEEIMARDVDDNCSTIEIRMKEP